MLFPPSIRPKSSGDLGKLFDTDTQQFIVAKESDIMPDRFNMHLAPFDRLSQSEQQTLRSQLDLAYFRAGQSILQAQQPCDYLHVLLKGTVEERSEHNHEVFAHYAHDDLFATKALFEPQSRHHYIALEDTLCYLAPKALFQQFYQQNKAFAAYFNTNLATRQQLVKTAEQQKNLAEFILTKVDKQIYQHVLVLPASCSVKEATLVLKQHDCDAAIIETALPQPLAQSHTQASTLYGIVTRTNLLEAIVIDGQTIESTVADIASYPVICIEDGDYLFDALILMTRQRVKRLLVLENHQPVGMLDMTQILSAFSTHSHVLTLQIARAANIEALQQATQQQQKLVAALHQNGIKIRFLQQLLAAINEQVIERAFELVVPLKWQAHCGLLVLGSEGRREQIVKTDQDNALIIEDGYDWPECASYMATLTDTLAKLGYPLCKGNVMVNNAQWVHSQQQWQQTLTQWTQQMQPEQVMLLAILSDAQIIAGNKTLLPPLKAQLHQQTTHNMLLLQQFTLPALHFALPLTFFGQVKTNKLGIDIKQGGIFPIVHGIRSLALEYGLTTTNTFERITGLQQLHILDDKTADNLSEALALLTQLHLEQQLQSSAQNQPQHSHRLQADRLDRTQRDLLRHSLHVVKKFKQHLRFHFQIRD